MEERVFTVMEAAGVLGCSRWTVQRLIREGWLNPPVGRSGKGMSARISGKSLFQYILYDHISRLAGRGFKDFKRRRKNFVRFVVQTRKASCLSKIEGSEKPVEPADPSPYPLPQGEG